MMAFEMAFSRGGDVRDARPRKIAFILEKIFSIGLRSGEKGGRNRTSIPLDSIFKRVDTFL